MTKFLDKPIISRGGGGALRIEPGNKFENPVKLPTRASCVENFIKNEAF